ncbi:MAG: response regulator, partial [Gammaproteobacteria bacterium]|nr:response regulator [Gammaproteobacteria bacterium]
QAYRSGEERDYDIVLLDWMMPEMNGIQTAIHITQESKLPDPPLVIMVSAYDQAKVMRQASRAGVVGYLQKPVNASVLFDTVMELMGKNLPRAHRRGTDTSRAQATRINGGGRRILLVEDQPINSQIAAEILERNGFVVEPVENGQLAVELIAGDPGAFDAVLMDLQMPVMDGFEATRCIRGLPGGADLPIIAMTAHALERERDKCEETGMNSHISKPVGVDLLLSELSRWLGIAATEVPVAVGTSQPIPAPTGVFPHRVPGIELAEGVARAMGNRALYAKLLGLFPRQYAEVLETIRQSIKIGDGTAAAREAHALAGSAGNLSMMSLLEAAKALQQALDEGESFGVALTLVEERFNEVIDSIHGLDLVPPGAGADSPADHPEPGRPRENFVEDITPLLRELDALLASNNLGSEKLFGRIMESVTDATAIEVLGSVGGSIEQLDYLEARRLLEQFTAQRE